jgi:serine/threonine-protein kinase RsbW
MGSAYRRMAALDLRAFLAAFDGRSVTSAAIDYAAFREHRGVDDEQALQSLSEGAPDTALPRVVYTVAAEVLYPQLGDMLADRSAVGLGFDETGNDIAVIVAQIDSKLEATDELTAFWCDRLEMLAVNAGFENYKLWIIAPEGFDAAAVTLLKERGAYGSSVRQALLLSRMLGARPQSPEPVEAYELTIPMGNETELIAAKTIEEIALRHGFSQKATNQIKTALVEACINAAEHSLSPDRRIHHRFAVESGRLLITVSNRGLRLQDRINAPASSEGRRGWGLQLMRSLMDEVRIDSVDDGTVITLIKDLPSRTEISSQ